MKKFDWQKIEKFVGGVKFAVIIITTFTLAMIYGTFQESWHGAEYANRLIYKSPFFSLMLAGFFLSVSMAALLRLPPKKRLYGFYTIHAGIIIVIIGSYITYYAGIDGNITLRQNTPARNIMLSQDVLRVNYLDRENKFIEIDLPFRAGAMNLNEVLTEQITLKKFFPFSEYKEVWKKPRSKYISEEKAFFHSANYTLVNAFASEEFTVSLHPETRDYTSAHQLGPLSIHLLPMGMLPCFQKKSTTGLIIWDDLKGECQLAEQMRVSPQKTSEGKSYLIIQKYGKTLSFFPEFSQWPVIPGQENKFNESSRIRVLSKKLYEQKPTLFLFGKYASFMDGEEWQVATFQEEGSDIDLPWMGATLTLNKYSLNQVPTKIPEAVQPMQDGGQVIIGNNKAALVNVVGHDYWVRNDRSTTLLVKGERIRLELTKQTLRLPYELTLNRFKMDTNPGTRTPASYESFVHLFTDEGTTKHHIYMNNPLKYGGFTFYQASYFPDNGGHGSVLSVNFDPGRPLKYFGSLILVLGCIWHYLLNKKKIKRPATDQLA